MFHWLRSKLKQPNGNLLALDIGTEFIKALLIRPQGNRGIIHGVGKARQSLNEMQNGVITDIASVIHHSRLAMEEAKRMAALNPDHLIMGIAGELIKGATRTIRYRRHDPQSKIHTEELKNIIHKVQWKAFEQIRTELCQETGFNEIDVKLVSASIIDVRVDDYPVSNPIGFQGSEITMNIFNAFSPLIHYGVIQSISAELNMDLLAITAEPYALTRSLYSSSVPSQEAIFVDIGGGTSDVAIVQNGLLEGTKMFTIGGRSFTKRLSRDLNVSFPEAEEIKLAYSGNRLVKQSHKIVAKALQADCDVWLTGFRLTLNECSHLSELPSTILLCGGGALLPEIKTILSESLFWKELNFVRKPQIRFIHPQDLKSLEDRTNTLHSPQDIAPMALAHVGLELCHEENIMNKILRKVVRLMQV